MRIKDSLIDRFIVQDLVISNLDENNFISLPVLYTRTEIPVAKDDIPTQEDIDQWPHLNGVYLPNVSAEIGLLIASDVPEALDPLEVKISQDGGPYASRTRIGWAVNGPLKRHHQGPRVTSFFVKVDAELQEMVEGFYNCDFSESIADSKTELSQDERRFMKRILSCLTTTKPSLMTLLPRGTRVEFPLTKESQATRAKRGTFPTTGCIIHTNLAECV